MTIRHLKQTSADRVTVILEDGEEIRTSLGVIASLRLFAGKDLEEDALSELRRDSCRSLCRDRALEYLSHRPMSRRELEKKLREKGENEDAVLFSLDWLEERGYLNDADYAARVARHYGGKGYGAGRIRSELSRRGVPREYWEDAMAQAPAPDEKLDRLIASKLRDPSDRDAVRKLSASLSRRGYSWEEIRSALGRVSDIEED